MIWKLRFYIKGEKIEAAFSLVISEHYWGKEIGINMSGIKESIKWETSISLPLQSQMQNLVSDNKLKLIVVFFNLKLLGDLRPKTTWLLRVKQSNKTKITMLWLLY